MIIDIQDNGLFLEMVSGGAIAFLHSSHIQNKFLGHPGTLGYRPGQEICVKYFGRDPVTGQLQVSRKALMVPPLGESLEHQSENNGQQQKPHWKETRSRRMPWWEEEEEEKGQHSKLRTRSHSKKRTRQWWEKSSVDNEVDTNDAGNELNGHY